MGRSVDSWLCGAEFDVVCSDVSVPLRCLGCVSSVADGDGVGVWCVSSCIGLVSARVGDEVESVERPEASVADSLIL